MSDRTLRVHSLWFHARMDLKTFLLHSWRAHACSLEGANPGVQDIIKIDHTAISYSPNHWSSSETNINFSCYLPRSYSCMPTLQHPWSWGWEFYLLQTGHHVNVHTKLQPMHTRPKLLYVLVLSRRLYQTCHQLSMCVPEELQQSQMWVVLLWLCRWETDFKLTQCSTNLSVRTWTLKSWPGFAVPSHNKLMNRVITMQRLWNWQQTKNNAWWVESMGAPGNSVGQECSFALCALVTKAMARASSQPTNPVSESQAM